MAQINYFVKNTTQGVQSSTYNRSARLARIKSPFAYIAIDGDSVPVSEAVHELQLAVQDNIANNLSFSTFLNEDPTALGQGIYVEINTQEDLQQVLDFATAKSIRTLKFKTLYRLAKDENLPSVKLA